MPEQPPKFSIKRLIPGNRGGTPPDAVIPVPTTLTSKDFLIGVHPDYVSLLNSPRKTKWFETMIDLSDKPEKRADAERAIKQQLATSTESREGIDIDRLGLVINWETDPGVTNIVGREVSIPTISFNQAQAKGVGNLQELQGVSIPIQFGEADPIHVIIIPDTTFDQRLPISYEQRKRHEMVHAIHPGIDELYHGEGALVAEIAAVTGEITLPPTPGDFFAPVDTSSVGTTPGFFTGYIVQGLAQLGYTQVIRDEVSIASTWIEEFIRNAALANLNSKVVRRVMACMSMNDIQSAYQELAPYGYTHEGNYPRPQRIG